MKKYLNDVLNGSVDNYMLPFYWQHGGKRKKIPEQMRRIYESGCRAVCVESRPHRDFCGEEWWGDMDVILSSAKSLGMKVWILDDDHFPTGHAVGQIKDHPELRKWQLIENHVDVMGPIDDALLLIEPQNDDHVLIGAYAYKRTGSGEECYDEPVCLNEGLSNGFLQFSLPQGCCRIFTYYKTRRGTEKPDYIDMLNEKSVKLLVDAVYEAHYAHYKEYFGTTIAGFFSDEPLFGNGFNGPHSTDRGMYDHRVGMPGLALPYSDKTLAMMKESLGYDPLPYLCGLWFDLNGRQPEIRHAYMDAVTKQYRDCFTRQLGDWCEDHGVMYIGHIIEDMNAHARLGCTAGHYFRALDGQHMSGIDIVLHQIIPGMAQYIHTCSSFGNNADPEFFDYVLAKLASSYANIGTQMKGRAMCEVFGAYGWAEDASVMKWLLDFLLVRGVNHFVPHAFSPDFPDPDCPPHFGAEGFDPQFEGFAALMDYGNKVSHLLSRGKHISSAAILYHADAEWMSRDGGAMLTQVPAKMLYDEHIDYDIIPADCFIADSGSRVYQAKAEDGKLVIGDRKYGVFIVPYAEKLPEKLLNSFEKLQKNGVKIIFLSEKQDKKELINMLDGLIGRDITVSGEYPLMRCTHYEYESGHVYMFVNESVNESVKTTVYLPSVKNENTAVMLDLLNTGAYLSNVNGGKLDIELSPYQSVIAVFGAECGGIRPEKKIKQTIPAELTFDIETALYNDLSKYTPYAKGVPVKELPNITDIKNDPGFSGRIRYKCKTDIPKGVCGIDLGDVGNTARLFCNSKDMGIRICPPYIFDLEGAVKDGENELVIEVSNTLANAVKDGFSAFLAIKKAGLHGNIKWLRS